MPSPPLSGGLRRPFKALHALLGIERFPGTDTVRNLFKRFRQGHIEAFWRPVWKWLLGLSWPMPADGFSLDLDSTIFQRSGHQEGARKGYNPVRPGRHSHYPLLAILAEAPLVLHAWLRSGNTGTARGAVAFLTEALSLMPATWKLHCVRADSGFFDNALLCFLEARAIPYIVVARLTTTVKRKAAGLAQWTRIDDNYAWARFSLQLHGWAKPREFFAIRERVRENKGAVGRRLIEVEGYTFRVFVTNRQGDAPELWRDYNQRACVEQHIEELKNDLQVDGFCMQDFFATESAFRELLRQVEAIDTELSSLDTATRDRDAIKARMSECQDESEARKLLKDLIQAEQDVTVKGIRRPRLQADLAELVTTSEKASNAALDEASRLFGQMRREAVAGFEDVLQHAQHESERPRVRQANADTSRALTVPTLVERQQRTLQTAHCSIGMRTVPLSDRIMALKSSLATIDRAQTARIEIAAEASRLSAACAAFLKAHAKG